MNDPNDKMCLTRSTSNRATHRTMCHNPVFAQKKTILCLKLIASKPTTRTRL